MEKHIDEQMSLKIIREAIENTKTKLKDNGFFYLLWGWLVLTASLLEYALLQFSSTHYHWVGWPILMTIGAIVSVIHGYRLGKRSAVITFIDTAIIYLWYGFLIAMIIIISMAMLSKMSFQLLNPLIMVLFGLGTFVSGGILKFRPLIVGGLISWVIAIIAFLIQSELQLLLMSVAIVIAYLVPGYMLRYRNDKDV